MKLEAVSCRGGRGRGKRNVATLPDRLLLNALLQYSADNIYFKDVEGKFLRVSRSHAEWLHAQNPESMLGKTDADYFAPEHAQEAARDEQHVVESGKALVAKTEKEVWPDGRETWVSTSKLPLRDESGRIIGTFGVSRDVTSHFKAVAKIRRLARKLREQNGQHRRDLRLAGELFVSFAGQVPKGLPMKSCGTQQTFACASFYAPAESLGGDFVVFKDRGDGRVWVLVCDVMGHGVQAALIAMLMRTWAEQSAGLVEDLGAWMTFLNRRLVDDLMDTETPFTATAFAFELNMQSGSLTYCIAGHPPPLKRRANRAAAPMDVAGVRSPGLGFMEEGAFRIGTDRLDAGDCLIIMTDGLLEARNAAGREFETKGVLEALQRISAESAGADSLMRGIVEGLHAHVAGREVEDDVCLLVIESLKHGRDEVPHQ